jgi:Mlc titration factor MtfA (ptsG expression regulator)
MFQSIRNWFNQRIIRRSNITSAQWQAAFASLPILNGLDAGEKQHLCELAILFIHHKEFEGTDGLSITPEMKLVIALQACLPILQLGMNAYDGWLTVIVYPAGFITQHVTTDQFGVEHRGRAGLAGESWLQGPVVLAWDETAHAGQIDGRNLVIHEFAHKLDMQNGRANGFPPLHKNMDASAWVSAFTQAFEDLQKRCEHGHAHDFDCYAATSPAEFFAVMSEVFFERPALLNRHYPDVYEQMQRYYRQNLLIRMSR